MTVPRVFYTPEYDISFWGIEKLHPFDSRKASRAWQRAHETLGAELDRSRAAPAAPADREALKLIHSEEYLDRLKRSSVIASVLEMPVVRLLPGRTLDRHVLLPMRWAVQGTIDAARFAVGHGCAVNLAGGYHHAHRDRGEGFCVYADVPIAIEMLRKEKLLSGDARVAIIDLDAHRGNGFEAIYHDDERVRFFDLYNFQVYPGPLKDFDPLSQDDPRQANTRFEDVRSLRAFMDDEGYLTVLKHFLPTFLAKGPYALAFYNAGTDVLKGDPLGRLGLSAAAVRERDRFVIESLEQAGIPWVMLPSGGYTDESHQLLADTVVWACRARYDRKDAPAIDQAAAELTHASTDDTRSG
jgi:histone deacetylase 11